MSELEQLEKDYTAHILSLSMGFKTCIQNLNWLISIQRFQSVHYVQEENCDSSQLQNQIQIAIPMKSQSPTRRRPSSWLQTTQLKVHSSSSEHFSFFSAVSTWELTRMINSQATAHITEQSQNYFRLIRTHMHVTFNNSISNPKSTLSKSKSQMGI